MLFDQVNYIAFFEKSIKNEF